MAEHRYASRDGCPTGTRPVDGLRARLHLQTARQELRSRPCAEVGVADPGCALWVCISYSMGYEMHAVSAHQ